MKVLLFTHISDIDGLNNIILAKEAFKDVDYVLCEPFEVDIKIEGKKAIFNQYDLIFVTDLCPTPKVLDYIDSSKLKNKFMVFDHHKDALQDNPYSFVNLKVSDEKGACCGTSLFYEYLVNSRYLKRNDTLDKLVELTRRYDTWEWKKYNDLEACNLTYLLNAIGIEEYLKRVKKRIRQREFSLTNNDMSIVNSWKAEFDKKISEIVNEIIYLNIQGYSAGVINTIYEYRNDIIEYVRENDYDVDFIAMVCSDKDSISYRNVKDIDVSEVARHYGGDGHRAAASSPITKEEKENIIEYFNK